jgi:amidase
MMTNLYSSSVSELTERIRTKKIASEEIVGAHIRRIEQVNPKLNAVVQMRAEEALAEAKKADEKLAHGQIIGPLHGVPMTIKDSFDTKDLISTAGSKGRENYLPPEDATVVKRLRKAGAILLGKTNTPELTLAYETDNLLYGRTNNPHDLTKSPGGRRGGAAAIIAAGGSPFDTGSDTGGSIRQPAHFCGIAGLKPTQGRVPRTGHFISYPGYLQALTHIGPMARYVDDLALLLKIISGPDWQDPFVVDKHLGEPQAIDLKKLRVAFYTEINEMQATGEIVQAVKNVARALQDEKAAVESAAPTCLGQSYELYYDLFHADGHAWVRDLLEKAGTVISHPFLAWALDKEKSRALSGVDFAKLLARWNQFRSEMLAFMQHYDALVCPVNAYPALPHGKSKTEPYRYGFGFSITYNLTGWPAVAVCAGKTSTGLPIGIQVVAAPWREDIALAVARFVEQAFGGWQTNKPTL